MRASLEPIVSGSRDTFYARRFDQPTFDHPLHYHPEVELTYIVKSSGTRIVGDHIGSFAPGDLCLIGANVPHIYRNTKAPKQGAISEVLHFRCQLSDDPGHAFGGTEWGPLRELVHRARLGLQFSKATAKQALPLLKAVREHGGLCRWAAFVDLAQCLMECKDLRELASHGYVAEPVEKRTDRMEQICLFILEHFSEDITHESVARHFNLAPSSFSRSFKRATRKTYQDFLNEVRLGHACRMLAETDATVIEIAFASGYRNLSNFNRRFKVAYGCTPREWRRQLAG